MEIKINLNDQGKFASVSVDGKLVGLEVSETAVEEKGGEKIKAIKLIREVTNLSLKDSKELVESFGGPNCNIVFLLNFLQKLVPAVKAKQTLAAETLANEMFAGKIKLWEEEQQQQKNKSKSIALEAPDFREH